MNESEAGRPKPFENGDKARDAELGPLRARRTPRCLAHRTNVTPGRVFRLAYTPYVHRNQENYQAFAQASTRNWIQSRDLEDDAPHADQEDGEPGPLKVNATRLRTDDPMNAG